MNSEPLPALWSRRRVLRTLLCSSAALAFNINRKLLSAVETGNSDDLHWLAIGDFGSQSRPQTAVAQGMQSYLTRLGLRPEGLLLLGDNFYGKMVGGVKSHRWAAGFEDMYLVDAFPGICPVVLGNHDYHDNPGGEQTQLAYAKQTPGTRWTLPQKWYRLDLPAKKPVVTFLCLDTNLRSVSSGTDFKTGRKRASLTEDEENAELSWLKAELAKPRAPWTICLGHHPIYSNGQHGDTHPLVARLAPLLQEYRVPVYICGHDHDLQHLELENQATSFVISGGGGARVRNLRRKERGPYGAAVYGFTHLQVRPGSLTLRHVDANGNQLHAFEKGLDGKWSVL